jgi:hypothetical protein
MIVLLKVSSFISRTQCPLLTVAQLSGLIKHIEALVADRAGLG